MVVSLWSLTLADTVQQHVSAICVSLCCGEGLVGAVLATWKGMQRVTALGYSIGWTRFLKTTQAAALACTRVSAYRDWSYHQTS